MKTPQLFAKTLVIAALFGGIGTLNNAIAGESLLGYTAGAEPLPKGALEAYQIITQRSDKGQGRYTAFDSTTELEFGFTSRFSGSIAVIGHSIDTQGLIIGGYLPQERNQSFSLSGAEGQLKYSFLTPALNDFGLSSSIGFEYDTIDKHSGQDKDTLSILLGVQAQKYFMDGQLVWLGNLDMESTHAKRSAIAGIDDEEEWPTVAEMEVGFAASTGLSYRFAPNWSIGAETLYENEYETDVGMERWTLFAGPSIHYGDKHVWSTLTFLSQLSGGGETYDGQTDDNLHLIEKTKQEIKLQVGYNF